MTDAPRKPVAFRLGEEAASAGTSATQRRRTAPPRIIAFEPDEPKGEVVVVPPRPMPLRRGWRWGLVLASALGSLVSLWAGFALTRLIEDFFARSQALGWLASGLAAIAGFAAVAIVLREILALARLRRIEEIQADAAHALNHNDATAAERAVAALMRSYEGRADAAIGLSQLRQHRGEIMDPADRIRLADRDLVSPLDDTAHRIIARTARRVTLLTAVTPVAALDIVFVVAQNLRMIRELATLYGGRPSTLSTFRLARMVISHLAVTGGLALSDNLLQHMVGKGLIGRLSARFGEGAVNGILTSRIGLAARDVCRPIPQEPQAKETLASLLKELVTIRDKPEDDSSQSQS